jgi:hypothetical protein
MKNGKDDDEPVETQSFLMPRLKFSRRAASAWIAKHGAEERKVDTTKNFFRFRQQPPGKFDFFRTIDIGNEGVKAVVGRKKKRST